MPANEEKVSTSYVVLANFYHNNNLLVRGQAAPQLSAKDAAQYLRDKLIELVK